MAEPVQQYGSISLSSRGGASQGLLRVNAGGFTWRRSTGGKHVDIKTEDVERLVWMRVSRGYMLGVRQRKGITMNFIGFRDRDLDPLREISKAAFNKDIEETSLSLTGKNWGDIAIHGSSMVFDVGSKPAFELPLPDVAQVDQQKDEVAMEFHLDDTVISDKEDALVGIAFHVPPGNQTFPPDEDSGLNPAKVFADNILGLTDAQATSAEDSVATLTNVSIQNPRGRFQVELHLGFMHLVGQNNDYKIRYTSIARLFILPKPNPPLTVVVVSLDPPIRKGQTYYQHILCQFDNKEELSLQLDLTSEQLAEKNERHGSQLKSTMSGTSWEVFAKVVKGLSGTKITKPNTFRAADGRSYAVKCSYKADDGFLFFLEKAFFYIHKPPLLIVHDEIASIEFQRQDRDMLAATVKTFDLAINTKQNTVHLFRGIQRQEYQEIFSFVEAKKLRIENFEEAARGPAVRQGLDLGDMMDPGMRAMAMGADSDEDDEDFEMGAEGRSGSDGGGSDSEGSEVEMVAEDGIQAADIEEKPRHPKPSVSPGASPSGGPSPTEKPRAPSGKKRSKAAAATEAAGGGEADAAPTGKKKRKKKDPNAPKRAQSAYLCFANRNREAVKQDNPDLKQTELMKAIADRWKELSAEDRKPYEELAAADKERYAREMAEYQAKNGAAAGGAGDADAAEAHAGDA